MKIFDNLEYLKQTTSLNVEWIEKTNAKPTNAALWCLKGKLFVVAIY